MVLSATEIDRAERVLIRNVAKRDSAVSQMNCLHDLAKNVHQDVKSLPIFRARKRDIDALLSQFNSEQDAILDLLIQLKRGSEYATDHAPLTVTMSNQYYTVMAIADELDMGTPSAATKITNDSPESSHIILPKIQLPNFNGDILQWVAFRDTFKSLVHNNNNLTNIERYHYLLSVLTGSAIAVVRSIPLSDTNYDVAWNALTERFDSPRLIMNAHMDKLFNFPTLKTSSLTELKLFLDTFHENIAALENFNIPNKEGYLFFYIATRVLDSDTRCLFESQYDNNKLPVIDDLLKYVQSRCLALQNSLNSVSSMSSVKTKSAFSSKKTSSFIKTSLMVNSSTINKNCVLCSSHHGLYKCEKFLHLSPSKRLKLVQSHRMCTNCLATSHTSSKCTSKYTCRHCAAKHHSLLHLNTTNTGETAATGPSPQAPQQPSASSVLVGTTLNTNVGVLGTALIRICDKYGQWVPVRALIDSGSQISAITQSCVSRLGLPRRQNNISVTGLSQNPIPHIKGVASCRFIPYSTVTPEFRCESVILHKITGTIPSTDLNPCIRNNYSDLHFADPSFDHPGPIDFLLGTDVYSQLFQHGYRIRHSQGLPSAFETSLGWIFVGTTAQYNISTQQVSLTVLAEPSLRQILQQFWNLEEPVVSSTPFTDQEKCEDLFTQTTTRDKCGRYTVSLPFKKDPSMLGESRTMALSRFFNLERKLQINDALYVEYKSFMNQYIQLGHMHVATSPGKYIIPHHAVVKYVDDQIKLRVVFDASARTTSGVSLNDIVFTGPKLQQEISDLLLQSRLYRYMFTADICKMYRQINMDSSHHQYQHIFWRNDPAEPLIEYALSTVTYGVACSPYQAIRILHQLETDEGANYPAAREILSSQTYVDDIITGENTVELVVKRQKQVQQLLLSGGFELKKWVSNCPEVLKNIPVEDQAVKLSFDPKDDSTIKILGLHWDPNSDIFSYHSEPIGVTFTKRCVLSSIAKIYDPLGTLAPITFWAKCFMQRLWQEGYDWDQPLSDDLSLSWTHFASELPCVSNIRIQRYIPVSESCDVQLIGFSDASLKGYSAVVYLRLSYASNPATLHLITAKSRVAPLKSSRLDESLSVPRLELCGALLLAQVMHHIQKRLSRLVGISSMHAWTDSTVVLSWLTNSQLQFKVFVTNRLKKIRELLPTCHWHHVSTVQNPADCASRGMFPKEALMHKLYWDGPSFLQQSPEYWSLTEYHPLQIHELPEQINIPSVSLSIITTKDSEWFCRFSTLTRLQRVIAYMRRFVNKTRRLKVSTGFLQHTELEQSLSLVIQLTQKRYFQNLHQSFTSEKGSSPPLSLIRLGPYLDNAGIIRVGGRLRHSALPERTKNPILLPKSSVVSILLIRHYHWQYLHAGPQLVSSLLLQRYWIVSARSVIRQILFKCVVCARHRIANHPPLMADLPPSRVLPSRPFSRVGVDYAGPFLLKEGRRKQAKSVKGYVALFICMIVKAVHIEVVSDLSTEAFLAALHRFVSRRGLPTDIYSDCGTNFRGANHDLRRLFSEPAAQELCAGAINCQWHFNPPASPHFGGLWEAAVKSCKYHMKRVIGSQVLTFEELTTLGTRIEAILNSRPITPQSNDPSDLRPLTPGHFLVGSPIVAIPEPDYTTTTQNRLRRWQLLSAFHQSFWTRWASEYLTSLQGRAKWVRQQPNVQVGDLIILRSTTLPPTAWRLGRIELVHPGDDGVVRVVTVRTTDGIYKRPVVKTIVLPMPTDP